MVDRITPATTDADREWLLTETGVIDAWPVVAEPFRQWVIEDTFAAERPPLEDLDVVVTTDVEPYEQMKLRLLNGSHSVLAYLAALRGFDQVHTAMADPLLRRFVRAFLDHEAGPPLPPVPGRRCRGLQDDDRRALLESGDRRPDLRGCAATAPPSFPSSCSQRFANSFGVAARSV